MEEQEENTMMMKTMVEANKKPTKLLLTFVISTELDQSNSLQTATATNSEKAKRR